MTAHDRPSRPVGAEPRSRLPIPSWMLAWPRGVQPVAIWVSRRGVELLFRAPTEPPFSWFRVVVSISSGGASEFQVRALPGASPEVNERLARAVRHHLSRSPAALEWLTRAHAALDSVASLPRFTDPAVLEQPEQALAQIKRHLGADVAELEVVLWLAAGSLDRALDAWTRHAQAIEARRDHRSLMCMALVHAHLGNMGAAQACAIELAGRTRDSTDAFHAGELLGWVNRWQLAVEQLLIAVSDVEGDSGSFHDWRRLAKAASEARRAEPLRRAIAAMCEQAQGPEQQRETAAMQREAGEFAAAEVTLERLLTEHPDDADGLLALASLRLWRGDHRGAATLAHARLARAPADAVALRTVGIAEFLARERKPALEHLGMALALDERDDEARLWRARVLDALGHYGEARIELGRVSLCDHVAWQLLRVLIEEHSWPGYHERLDTWFIVDQNIRQLLGDDTPPDTRAGHEVAVGALEAALARLGGNHSSRLTTPTRAGSLRWLEGVESPRRRSEHLQLQAGHRPLDEVLVEFQALAAAHPDVPFFTTYAAELLLWRGEYERALEQFSRIWTTTRTRWGYVGAGAAAMLLGRDEQAMQLWDEGASYFTYLDAEATYCYRGELSLRRGDHEAAQVDLEQAVRARPERLGAWIDLALLHHARGREQPMREAAARVEQLCPAFTWLVRRELGWAQGPWSPDVLARELERLRERMRGNRSSVMYTMVDADGLLRVIQVGLLAVWPNRARRALARFDGELLSV